MLEMAIVFGVLAAIGFSPARLVGNGGLFRLDASCLAARSSLTVGLILGSIGLLAAALLVAPATEPTGMGIAYAELAADPFGDIGNPIRHRILTPLLAYLLGLRGDGILILNVVFAWLLLVLVAQGLMARFRSVALAAIGTLTFAWSLVVATTLASGGYTDALTLLIIYALWRWRKTLVVFLPLFLLGLFNRESLVFLLPWFVWIRVEGADRRVWRAVTTLGALMLAIFAYVAIRWALELGGGFGFGFYLEPLVHDPLYGLRRVSGNVTLGWWSVFRVLWLIPIAAGLRSDDGRGAYLTSTGILLFCSGCQLLVAYDTSRMWTTAFMIMVVALERLWNVEPDWLRRNATKLLAVHVFVPTLFTAGTVIKVVPSPLGRWLWNLL